MYRRFFVILLVSNFFIFLVLPQTAFANSYFDQMLAGITKNFSGIFTPLKGLVEFKSVEEGNETIKQTQVSKKEIKTSLENENTNPYLDNQTSIDNYFSEGEGSEGETKISKTEEKKIREEAKKQETKQKTDSLVEKILTKLGLFNTTQNISTPTQTVQTVTPYQQPSIMSQLLGGNGGPFGNNPNASGMNKNGNAFNNTNGQGNMPNSLQNYLPGGGATLATPYTGPGGSLPGDCGIPKGPVAYNIGGNSVRCDAKTIVSGYMGQLRGSFGAGYINPMTEKGQTGGGSSASNCAEKSTAQQYGEGCYRSYQPGSDGAAYVQKQLLHWQQQGQAKGQKCVPVDIDNCDSIGNANYKNILDQVEQLNNQGSVKIKVLTKNPHIGNCNFLSHPAVVGAFIEEISPSDAQKVSSMRSKPEQLLIFARGGGGSNQKLKQIENLKIPNSSYSYDQGGEYQNIIDCTYNP